MKKLLIALSILGLVAFAPSASAVGFAGTSSGTLLLDADGGQITPGFAVSGIVFIPDTPWFMPDFFEAEYAGETADDVEAAMIKLGGHWIVGKSPNADITIGAAAAYDAIGATEENSDFGFGISTGLLFKQQVVNALEDGTITTEQKHVWGVWVTAHSGFDELINGQKPSLGFRTGIIFDLPWGNK